MPGPDPNFIAPPRKDTGGTANNPAWDKAGRVHDWRNHVPGFIRCIWFDFTSDQRAALFKWADDMASAEEWE